MKNTDEDIRKQIEILKKSIENGRSKESIRNEQLKLNLMLEKYLKGTK